MSIRTKQLYKTLNFIIYKNGVYDMRIGKFIYFDTNMECDPICFDVRNIYIINDLCIIVVYVHTIERIQFFKCCICRFSDGSMNIFPLHSHNLNYKCMDGINIDVLYQQEGKRFDITHNTAIFAKWNKYYVSINFDKQTIIFNEKFDIVLSHEGECFAEYPNIINPLFLAHNNIIISSELNITNMANIYFIKWISVERFKGSQDGKTYIYNIKNNVIKLVDENECLMGSQDGKVKKNVIKLVDENEKECSICMTYIKKKIALVPCGHTDICQECSNKIKTCPICKSEIEKVIRIF